MRKYIRIGVDIARNSFQIHALESEDCSATKRRLSVRGDAGDHTYWNYANLAAAYAPLGKMDEAKPFVAETLRVNPSFTINWFQNHTTYVIPKRDEGFRKAGFAED